jgi:acetolactate synthase-1/2/3 large subunit
VVDIPKDITNPTELFPFEYPDKLSIRSYNPVSKGHSGQIKKAMNMLLKSERPVIYTGGGVIQGNGAEELVKLVKAIGYPITSTLMGLGAYPATDKQFLGMLGMHGTFEANNAMHHCDLLLAIGARFDDRVTNTISKFCPYAKIVHVDIDPASISKNVVVDVPIVGPVDVVLKEMNKLVDDGVAKRTEKQADVLSQWWEQIEGWRKQDCLKVETDKGSKVIKPQQVVQAVYKATAGDAYVSSDVGQHQMFAALYYPFDKPRRWINSGGLGTMGFGLPAAMGVQLAFPDMDVACVTGEGSIQMNIQELSTCTQYKTPVKIINLRNNYLGMVKQWQDMQYEGRYAMSTYEDSLPDFVKLVEAYGHVGMVVDKLKDLDSAMDEAFAMKDKLVFLDVFIDRMEHVYPMHIAPNGSMKDMWLSKNERT